MMFVGCILLVPSLALVCTVVAALSQGPTFVRVHNDTGLDFEKVVVITNRMGRISAGSTSSYRQFSVLYRKPTVLTSYGKGGYLNDRAMNEAGGYEGLPAGYYTVFLGLDAKSLSIKVEKDR
jgi:hypothetical protein